MKKISDFLLKTMTDFPTRKKKVKKINCLTWKAQKKLRGQCIFSLVHRVANKFEALLGLWILIRISALLVRFSCAATRLELEGLNYKKKTFFLNVVPPIGKG